MTATIIRAKAGQVHLIHGEPVMLWSACAGVHASLGCIPCNQLLANEGQLEMHTESGGTHVIARYCVKHGWEGDR